MSEHRERVLRAIKFEFPDKIPITYSAEPRTLMKYGDRLKELFKKYPNDFYDVNSIEIPLPKKEFYREDGSYYREWTDEWGATWVEYIEGISGEVKKSPLDDWSKLKDYKIPSPQLAKKEDIEKQKENYVGWGGGCSLFERMQWLRGVENLYIDIAEDRSEVYELADRITDEYNIPIIKSNIEAGVEIMGFAEDWGSQRQLLINPNSFRKIFKPRYKKMFDICKSAGIYTWLHSDGMIMKIIQDFIEIGLNVINPQLSCMDLKKLREITYRKICIATDIDRQFVLVHGTPEEIRNYIKKVYEIFGDPAGGLIYLGGIGGDSSFKNIEAMLKSFYEFRDL